MEKDAYLQGNMCFRDWEDGVKAKNPTIYNERRIYKMDYNDWRAKELGKNLLNKWGFKMDLDKLNENKEETLEEEEELEEVIQERSDLDPYEQCVKDRGGDEAARQSCMQDHGGVTEEKLEEITMGGAGSATPEAKKAWEKDPVGKAHNAAEKRFADKQKAKKTKQEE